MRKAISASVAAGCMLVSFGSHGQPAACPEALERQNVIWTSPSENASGSMPIGNGEVGLNVWVDRQGDLLFYIARTDAWSETSRLLKLGRARVRLTPNPFKDGQPFRQELRLREGRIEIRGGKPESEVLLRVWVDADSPVVHVAGESKEPVAVRATIESWRAVTKKLEGQELESSWTLQEAPPETPIYESGDVVYSAKDQVVFYHRNDHSIVPMSLALQGLSSATHAVKDPLLGRAFGGVMSGENFRSTDAPVRAGEIAGALVTRWPAKEFSLRIATHSAVTSTVDDWLRQVSKLQAGTASAKASLRRTEKYWNELWDRSWVFVDAAPETAEGKAAELITRGYTLQRWMTAAAGRGSYPIKFNGSLFTVEPEFSGGPKQNPDWRRWGDCYWWQNTRLPYAPMLARGDLDQLPPLFKFYQDAVPLAKARVRIYGQGEGIYFPETVSAFGTWANRDYGWKRAGHRPDEVLNTYIRHIWQPGLELVDMMLDYYDHTQDERFLRRELLPMAREVLRYFETRFGKDGGLLKIEPTQSVETYWFGVVNDTPTVAGLRRVTKRLLDLPKSNLPRDDRQYVEKLAARVPPVPLTRANGALRIAPAERFEPRRNNVENPELYAIWPFRLYGLGRPDLQVGVDTFNGRIEKSTMGWSYDAQCAALLGLANEAARQLTLKAGNSHTNHRFPAMWGPNYDWVPDQDHGSSLMLTLQFMLLQESDGKLLICPAWPTNWNADFRLHASERTTITGRVKDGAVTNLRVQPKSREKDVVLGAGWKMKK